MTIGSSSRSCCGNVPITLRRLAIPLCWYWSSTIITVVMFIVTTVLRRILFGKLFELKLKRIINIDCKAETSETYLIDVQSILTTYQWQRLFFVDNWMLSRMMSQIERTFPSLWWWSSCVIKCCCMMWGRRCFSGWWLA